MEIFNRKTTRNSNWRRMSEAERELAAIHGSRLVPRDRLVWEKEIEVLGTMAPTFNDSAWVQPKALFIVCR